jgi:hypothetical protein
MAVYPESFVQATKNNLIGNEFQLASEMNGSWGLPPLG